MQLIVELTAIDTKKETEKDCPKYLKTNCYKMYFNHQVEQYSNM